MLPSGMSTLSPGCQTSGLLSLGVEDGNGKAGVGDIGVYSVDVGAERARVRRRRRRSGLMRYIVVVFGGRDWDER
jgi:hypothetical protein